jgi:MFS family permease
MAIYGVTTLAQSLIWGVNTLFLLGAGLSIFQVLLANAGYTAGQVIFEVPTGVIADTLGRRVSYLIAVVTILASTLLYVYFGAIHAGIVPFLLASLLLGLGYCFYTGAVDAWLVDALGATGYTGKVEVVFARGGVIASAAMLIGSVLGGILGSLALWVPYVLRAVLLAPAFLIGFLWMKELGFTTRRLDLAAVHTQSVAIAKMGLQYGFRDRVVRPLMFSSFVMGAFGIYGFYSWQKYFLDLLGRNLVWVDGVIAALVALAGMLGSALVGPLSRRIGKQSTIVIAAVCVQVVTVIGAASIHVFWVAVPLYLVAATAMFAMQPVKLGWLNLHIPSGQRATLISFDALFDEAGGTVGQVGLGYLSQAVSIPFAWLVGGALQIFALPLLVQARRASADAAAPDEGRPPGALGERDDTAA